MEQYLSTKFEVLQHERNLMLLLFWTDQAIKYKAILLIIKKHIKNCLF